MTWNQNVHVIHVPESYLFPFVAKAGMCASLCQGTDGSDGI